MRPSNPDVGLSAPFLDRWNWNAVYDPNRGGNVRRIGAEIVEMEVEEVDLDEGMI